MGFRRGGHLFCMASSLQLFVLVVNANTGNTELTLTTTIPITQATPSARPIPVIQSRDVHLCRDRQGRLPAEPFRLHTCAMCLHYLLGSSPGGTGEFHLNVSRGYGQLQSSTTWEFLPAEPGNQWAMEIVCRSLSSRDCEDWTACCQTQVLSSSWSRTGFGADDGDGIDVGEDDEDDESESCPMTWDGYLCVNATAPGVTAVLPCPAFITRFTGVNNGQATRQCWPNSTWYTSSTGQEWTDYTTCHKTEDHETILTLKLVFKAISLALLLPSIAIFLKFRPLRSQLRIKLHINLFLSLAVSAVFSLLWEVLVSRDAIIHSRDDAFLTTHEGACKFLNVMSRYSLMTTFFWMFCEGLYLTWLMVRTFQHISSLLGFALFGWGTPILLCAMYVIIRVVSEDDSKCWVTGAGGVEWLLNGPTVACIAVNLLFLVAIMRVMLCKLRSHIREDPQSKFTLRRSLRALLILVPLFGLQEFCLLYRPQPSAQGFYFYEVVSAAVINLQGAVVALIFCFFNGEVKSHLKDVYKCLAYKLTSQRGRGGSRQSLSLTSTHPASTPHRPSLTSIDTTASVILTPLHIPTNIITATTTIPTNITATTTIPTNIITATTTIPTNITATITITTKQEDDASSSQSGGPGGRVSIPSASVQQRRVFSSTFQDSVAEHDDQEWEASSSVLNSNFLSVDCKESSHRTGPNSSGLHPQKAGLGDCTLEIDPRTRTSNQDTMRMKKWGFLFITNLWSNRRMHERNTKQAEPPQSETVDYDSFDPVNTVMGRRNPAVVVSQYENCFSGHVETADEVIQSLDNVRDVSYKTATDDGASSKSSECRDDFQNWRHVQESLADIPSPSHVMLQHVQHTHKPGAIRKIGHCSVFRSAPIENRCLCCNTGSLQGSQSSASFSSCVPSEACLEEVSVDTIGQNYRVDLSGKPSQVNGAGLKSLGGFVVYENAAFENESSEI